MPKPFNPAQARLLANFSSDLAKGLLLAGVSAPFVSKETLAFRGLFTLVNSATAIVFLTIAINLLKGVRE